MVNLVCRKLSIWFHRDLDMQNRKLQEFRLLVPPAIAQWFWDICAFLSMGLYNLLTHNFRTGYDYDWFLPVPAPQPIQKRQVVYTVYAIPFLRRHPGDFSEGLMKRRASQSAQVASGN